MKKYLIASAGINVVLLLAAFSLFNCYLVYKYDAKVLSVLGHSGQNSLATPGIDQSSVFYSPDRSKKIYLEKEYRRDIQRFVRQAVVFEDVASGEKKILKQSRLTKEQALATYTPDGCRVENGFNFCCNSKTDFNQYVPQAWTSDNIFKIDEVFDNYECSGAVSVTTLYNGRGEEYLNATQKKQLDFVVPESLKVGGFDSESFLITDACLVGTSSDVDLVLQKSMFGGYSVARLNNAGEVVRQYVQAKDGKALFEDIGNCDKVTSTAWLDKYFILKTKNK